MVGWGTSDCCACGHRGMHMLSICSGPAGGRTAASACLNQTPCLTHNRPRDTTTTQVNYTLGCGSGPTNAYQAQTGVTCQPTNRTCSDQQLAFYSQEVQSEQGGRRGAGHADALAALGIVC